MYVKASGLPKHADYVPEWGWFVLIPGPPAQLKLAPDTSQPKKVPVSKPPLTTRLAFAAPDAKRSKTATLVSVARIHIPFRRGTSSHPPFAASSFRRVRFSYT